MHYRLQYASDIFEMLFVLIWLNYLGDERKPLQEKFAGWEFL